MRAPLTRLVSIGLLLLQVAALAGLPAWRVQAAPRDVGGDFCTTSPDRGTPGPHAPAPSHPTHACGDCCLAWGEPPAAPAAAAGYPTPDRERAVDAETSVDTASRACVLPPACGPPSLS